MPKSARRQFLVSAGTAVSNELFATKTGGNITAEVTRSYDGGDLRPELIPGPPTADNVTVTRPYKPERDADLLARLKPLCGKLRTTLSVTPTNADLVPVARPELYPDALLVSVNSPEPDASSGDAATLTLEFATGEFA